MSVDEIAVLQNVSGLVVRALLEGDEREAAEEPFADALRRYRESAPIGLARWRSAAAADLDTPRVTGVLRRLMRDLLHDVSRLSTPAEPVEGPVEATPANVLPIGAAREVPALEQAADGTWRPSSDTLAGLAEPDALRRPVPILRSRYPEVTRGGGPPLAPPPLRD